MDPTIALLAYVGVSLVAIDLWREVRRLKRELQRLKGRMEWV
jgi:hypothetical protein